MTQSFQAMRQMSMNRNKVKQQITRIPILYCPALPNLYKAIMSAAPNADL
jgi:hypothetical protein